MSNYHRMSRQERLHEIQLAALEVFLDKGYPNTTMEDIIANTSLSKGGFYHYYDKKESILLDLIRAKNLNYLRSKLKVSSSTTKEELCDLLARTFAERSADLSAQNKLHLMVATELAHGTDEFYKAYNEVENETLTFIVDTIKKVIPDFNAEAKQNEMILLYRINNTLHFVNNLYTSKDGWNVDTELLYKLFYELFLKMADN